MSWYINVNDKKNCVLYTVCLKQVLLDWIIVNYLAFYLDVVILLNYMVSSN